MTNKQILLNLNKIPGTPLIDQLIWVAAAIENSELEDILSAMDPNEWKTCFPEIYNSPNFGHYVNDDDDEWENRGGERIQALIDFEKLGFIAEVHIAECKNFRYKDEKPISWQPNRGTCRVKYVYAETTDDLMKEIEKVSAKLFNEFMEIDKKKQANLKTSK